MQLVYCAIYKVLAEWLRRSVLADFSAGNSLRFVFVDSENVFFTNSLYVTKGWLEDGGCYCYMDSRIFEK
jgi:hypothetical protein